MAEATGRVRVEVAGGPSAEVPYTQSLTALGALELAQGQIEPDPNEQFTFGLQYYGSGLGYLVSMVNETYDSFISRGGEKAAPFFYWAVILNGVPATASIDRTTVKGGDVIRLEFQMFSPSEHSHSLTAHKHSALQRARN